MTSPHPPASKLRCGPGLGSQTSPLTSYTPSDLTGSCNFKCHRALMNSELVSLAWTIFLTKAFFLPRSFLGYTGRYLSFRYLPLSPPTMGKTEPEFYQKCLPFLPQPFSKWIQPPSSLSGHNIFMLDYFLSPHPLIQSINTSIDPASNSCPKSAWLLTALLTSSAACSVHPSWNPQQATPALCTPFRQSFGQPTSSHSHVPGQASRGGCFG